MSLACQIPAASSSPSRALVGVVVCLPAEVSGSFDDVRFGGQGAMQLRSILSISDRCTANARHGREGGVRKTSLYAPKCKTQTIRFFAFFFSFGESLAYDLDTSRRWDKSVSARLSFANSSSIILSFINQSTRVPGMCIDCELARPIRTASSIVAFGKGKLGHGFWVPG